MPCLLCEQFGDVETLPFEACFILLRILDRLLVVRVLSFRRRETARPFNGLDVKALVIGQHSERVLERRQLRKEMLPFDLLRGR